MEVRIKQVYRNF